MGPAVVGYIATRLQRGLSGGRGGARFRGRWISRGRKNAVEGVTKFRLSLRIIEKTVIAHGGWEVWGRSPLWHCDRKIEDT